MAGLQGPNDSPDQMTPDAFTPTTAGSSGGRLSSAAARYGDVALAGLAVGVIALIVLPLPPWMLDSLITVNIASGIILLLFALYVPTPLAFSTFPAVLLFTTLFRIALNVATTRQILLNADAGAIIETFGRMVVGGSLIIGLVVFLIITVVQFIVIAKGAERVAEVGARFVLDALPGKQMAIDSDMRAGMISQEDAMRMRERLNLESQFFGSMDGAMKFVKGDAIASIVIVVVNLLGGMAVGVLANDLSMGDAARTYGVLSIGDGLVTQVPALFIAMAAGVVVTRTTPEHGEHLAGQIGAQVAAQPRALILAGVVLAAFALVPGFPPLPFLILGSGCVFLGLRLLKRIVRQSRTKMTTRLQYAGREGDTTPRQVIEADTSPFVPLALDLHPSMLRMVALADLDAELLEMRRRLTHGLGLPFPGLTVRAQRRLPEGSYAVSVLEIGGPVQVVAQSDDSQGIARAVVKTIEDALRDQGNALIGVQETRWLLIPMEANYPDLTREALNVLPLPRVADLLAALVAEGVSVRDLRSILEAVVDHAAAEPSLYQLTERVRGSLARVISHQVLGERDVLAVVGIDPYAEQMLRDQAQPTPDGLMLLLGPDRLQAIAQRIMAAQQQAGIERSVLLTAEDLRAPLLRLLRPLLPRLTVLSPSEISAVPRIHVIDRLDASMMAAG